MPGARYGAPGTDESNPGQVLEFKPGTRRGDKGHKTDAKDYAPGFDAAVAELDEWIAARRRGGVRNPV